MSLRIYIWNLCALEFKSIQVFENLINVVIHIYFPNVKIFEFPSVVNLQREMLNKDDGDCNPSHSYSDV